jgi:exonuclease VII large subunit
LINKTKNEIDNLFFTIKGKIEKVINNFKIIEYKIEKVIPKRLENEIKKIGERIKNIEGIIKYNDPQRNLKLGYCITRNEKGIIKSIKSVKENEDIDIMLYDGIINSKIKKIYERKKSKK